MMKTLILLAMLCLAAKAGIAAESDVFYSIGPNSQGVQQYVPVTPTAPLPATTSKTLSACVSLIVTTANSYGVNYVIGGLLAFPNVFTATGTGLLQGVTVTMKDLEQSGFTFIPFNATPSATTWTDAAVAAINATDVAKVRPPVTLSNNIQLAASGFSVQFASGLAEALAPGTTSLSGVLVANATLTTQFAASTDVQVCVAVLADP